MSAKQSFFGNGEVHFKLGATTAAGFRAGHSRWKDVTGVKYATAPNFVDFKLSDRGRLYTAEQTPTEIVSSYDIKRVFLDQDMVKMMYYGTAKTNFTQAAIATATATDTIAYTSGAPSNPKEWVQLTKSSAKLRNLSTFVITDKVEGTDYEIDKTLGQVRFITAFTADVTPTVTCPAITTVADDGFMYGVDPFLNVIQTGFASVFFFDNRLATNKCRWAHEDFSCQFIIKDVDEITNEKHTVVSATLKVTDTYGTVWAADPDKGA
jgi:hypothetical protein